MIAILGAGSLGRLWAATLPAGQVAFVPRPAQSPAPEHYDFSPVSGPPRNITIPWLSARQTPTMLLVTTKAGDTLAALSCALLTLPESVPVVLFQNGLGSQQQVADTWPERPILAAATTEGANRPRPDQLMHAGAGATHIGALTSSGKAHQDTVIEALHSSGLTVVPADDIMHRLWQKLIVNAGINPFTAILDCLNGELLQQPFFQRWIDPLCNELSQLLVVAGQPAQSPRQLRDSIEAVARATAGNTSSMRADVLAGRATEINYINGYLVRLAEHVDIDAPVSRMLTHKVEDLI